VSKRSAFEIDQGRKEYPVPSGEHKVVLIFIINGENFSVETDVNAPLMSAVQRALAESHNTGRDPSEWEVRDSNGVLLEVHRPPKELGLTDNARLFLSLRVGAGGATVDR
jgi:hypothetical protein